MTRWQFVAQVIAALVAWVTLLPFILYWTLRGESNAQAARND